MPTERIALSLIVIQALLAGAAALVMASAARHGSGRDRRGWSLVAAGLALWTVACAVLAVRLATGATNYDDSAVDGIFLVAVATMVVGLMVVPPVRGRRGGSRRVDAAIVTVSALSVMWAAPFESLFNAPAGDGRIVPISAMVGELGMYSLPSIVLAVAALSTAARRRPDPSGTLGPMVAGLVAFNLGDLLFLLAASRGSGALFVVADGAYLCGGALALMAALRLHAHGAGTHGGGAHPTTAPSAATTRPGPFGARPAAAGVRPRFPEIATFVGVVSLALHELVYSTHTAITIGLGLTLVVLSTLRTVHLQREQRVLHRELLTAQRQLRLANGTDALTGLGNRSALDDQLTLTLSRPRRRSAPPVSVFFIDLDHFKRINDGLGHHVGDALLVDVAERLRAVLGDSVFRIGGDEFVGVRDDLAPVEVEKMATTICSVLATPVMIEGHELSVGASLGVALTDPDPTDPDPLDPPRGSTGADLLRRADLALYGSKDCGRGSWRTYDAQLQRRADDRLEIQQGLHRALGSDELKVHLRPVVDLGSRSVCGAQAYLRWHSPRHGVLTPREYLEVASEGGLLPQLDQQLFTELARALRTAGALEASGEVPSLWISTALSRAEVVHPGLGDELAEVIGRAGVPPDRLRVEVGEDVIADPVGAESIDALVALGVGLTISSFGTGPAALMGLASTPAAGVKLDRSFVEHLGRRAEDTIIVETVAQLARELDLELGAEGVAEQAQLERLADLGFDTVQGRLVGGPLLMSDFFTWLADHRPIGAEA